MGFFIYLFFFSFFFARITSRVFLTDCDERFENLTIVLERIAPASLGFLNGQLEPFKGMTILSELVHDVEDLCSWNRFNGLSHLV